MSAPCLPDPTTCTCDAGGSGDRRISPEELAEHRTEGSCWVLLRGAVWDLTPFLADHPGGPGAILEFAGRDATGVWESVHPPEVLAQLPLSLRVGEPDNTLAAAVEAPETTSERLLHACKMGGSTEVDALLAAKADPDHRGGQGKEAPLHWAARKGLPPMVAALLAASASLEIRGADGQTPLHLAAQNGQNSVVTELLTAKAEINAADGRGNTPLHAAAALGSVRLVKLLLGRGADINVQNQEGNAAEDVASERGNMAVENIIAAHTG